MLSLTVHPNTAPRQCTTRRPPTPGDWHALHDTAQQTGFAFSLTPADWGPTWGSRDQDWVCFLSHPGRLGRLSFSCPHQRFSAETPSEKPGATGDHDATVSATARKSRHTTPSRVRHNPAPNHFSSRKPPWLVNAPLGGTSSPTGSRPSSRHRKPANTGRPAEEGGQTRRSRSPARLFVA